MSDAFISYSHLDRDFAVRLQRALRDSGKEIWVDEADIPSGARWAEDLKGAIEDADSFVFIISPDSVASEECKKELNYAVELNKRIIPLNLRLTPFADLPDAIRAVQFVPPRGPFENDPDPTSENTFENSLPLLIATIDTDLDATREHTEWGKKALEWDKHTQDRSFLLTGSELEAAEQWLVRRTDKGPEPTDLQKSYVLASRQGARVVSAGCSVGSLSRLWSPSCSEGLHLYRRTPPKYSETTPSASHTSPSLRTWQPRPQTCSRPMLPLECSSVCKLTNGLRHSKPETH